MSGRVVPVRFPITVCMSCTGAAIVASVVGTDRGAFTCAACSYTGVRAYCDADTMDYAPEDYAPLIDTCIERVARAVWGVVRRTLT